ncbi:ribosomal RNA small subunit methyltransferase E [Bacteroidia bacterium]|nr:ribosomal RNA small subunit methyltransferase E [Bacteroidia bacterium]
MHFFYINNIFGDIFVLDEEESQHCIRVLRLTNGDAVHLIDGKGGLYTAYIVNAHPKHCEVKITETQQGFGKHNYFLHIGIAPTKNIDRYEWFLEKATEIGTDCITPLLCEHSERKMVKHEHSQKIIVAATKQSLSAYLPDLQQITAFVNFVRQPFDGIKCIAHCCDAPKIAFRKAIENARRILVLIGAEGDFSPAEIALAKQNGFVEVSLGNRRLRTETAGIAACHTVAVVNE